MVIAMTRRLKNIALLLAGVFVVVTFHCGASAQNSAAKHGRYANEYNWSATPSVDLGQPGSKVANLSSCPPGVNAHDSDIQKTIATANNHPANDANDASLGYDEADGNPANVGISLGAPKSISSYVGNIGDGKNWMERLTKNLKSFHVPLTTDSPIASTVASGTAPLVVSSNTPVANLTLSNHPRIQTCGTTQACVASTVTNGQIVFGTVTLARGEAMVKGFNPAFKTAESFQCTARDKTTAVNAANAVALSGNSVVVRGPGNDVIAYMCAGS